MVGWLYMTWRRTSDGADNQLVRIRTSSTGSTQVDRSSVPNLNALYFSHLTHSQGGAIYIRSSTATFVNLLSMVGNTDADGPSDIIASSSTVSCETPCTAGQYGQCDFAHTQDPNFQCPIDCRVRSSFCLTNSNPGIPSLSQPL